MKILLLDNYDSFTYNLVQLVRENTSYMINVYRNNEIGLDQVNEYDKIIISPGPGLPHESGILCEMIKHFHTSKHILGICLGMQAIAEVLGGKLNNINEPMHGVSTPVKHTSSKLFKNIPEEFLAGRYHSWEVDRNTLPEILTVTCSDELNTIMAIEHKTLNICGVQFHPESILTEYGKEIILNFLNN